MPDQPLFPPRPTPQHPDQHPEPSADSAQDPQRLSSASPDADFSATDFSVPEAMLLSLATPTHRAPARLRARLLQAIAETPQHPAISPSGEASSANDSTQPTPASPPTLLALSRQVDAHWEQLPFPGISMRTLFLDPRTNRRTLLVRLQPGAAIPAHRHHDDEQCLILEGRVEMHGVEYGPGDFFVAANASLHQPITSSSGALLFLVTGHNDYF